MARTNQSLSRKRVASEDLVSDDGSVERAPKQKKTKVATSPREGRQKDENGNDFWELSNYRRVQVSEFRGSTQVALREYYEKDGKMNPGKKGLSLTVDQFNTFVKALPEIEATLKSKGFEVSRPSYKNAAAKATADSAKDDEEGDDDEEDEEEDEPQPSRKQNTKSKPNHEATSDEDEDD